MMCQFQGDLCEGELTLTVTPGTHVGRLPLLYAKLFCGARSIMVFGVSAHDSLLRRLDVALRNRR